VLGRQHPVRGQQRERAATGALTEEEGDRGCLQGHQVREAARDLAREATFLGLHRECRAGGVDNRQQRQSQLGGEPHPAACLTQRPRTQRALRGLLATVLTQDDAGRPSEAGEREQQPRIGLPLAGPVERDDVAGGVPEQAAYAGSVRSARPLDRLPRRRLRQFPHTWRERGHGFAVGVRAEHRQGTVEHLRDVGGLDDGVDETVAEEVLGDLDTLGEVALVQRLVDPRPEEADQGARLGDGQLPQRPPRREHATGRGMAQVDEVGQPGRLVPRDRRGDLHHLDERAGALLHPGAARHRRGQQRQARCGRPFDRVGETFGGGGADRPGEEGELTDHHGHPPSVDAALTGQHRLVDLGPLPCRGQLGCVPLRHLRGRDRCGVPRAERPLVEDEVDEVVRPEPGGHGCSRSGEGPGEVNHGDVGEQATGASGSVESGNSWPLACRARAAPAARPPGSTTITVSRPGVDRPRSGTVRAGADRRTTARPLPDLADPRKTLHPRT